VESIDYKNPRLLIETGKIEDGSVSWRSPSNLAIVKYWGKQGVQLPRNPSISFTLDQAYTETTIYYQTQQSAENGIQLEFYFEGELNETFGAKVRKYLESLTEIFPFIRQLNLVIRSRNSFPHSSGIASSASGMSAIALCLCSMEHHFFGTLPDDELFRRKASYVARLGSGSACRSIFSTAAVWGESGEVKGSSDLYAVPFENEIHDVFKSYHDDILIVSKGEKAVSSRVGHALMDENIYAENRYRQARQRFHQVLRALTGGDIEHFGQIAEGEALTLHALMMVSTPPFILMKPNTIALIQKVRQFRETENIPLCFSLDAGPNLHLLYPHHVAAEVQSYIKEELLAFCENGQWIADQVGQGPLEL
jgi:diphosphomevalonate decarboxylase